MILSEKQKEKKLGTEGSLDVCLPLKQLSVRTWLSNARYLQHHTCALLSPSQGRSGNCPLLRSKWILSPSSQLLFDRPRGAHRSKCYATVISFDEESNKPFDWLEKIAQATVGHAEFVGPSDEILVRHKLITVPVLTLG